MNASAIYPGTFDPVTLGHEDVIERAAKIFDLLIVAVVREPGTKDSIFTADERVELISQVVHENPRVEVEIFDGLLVDYARNRNIGIVVRGLRAFSDFEYEFQMALTNRKMAPEIETLFLMPKEDTSYVSSSIVREVARLGGDISQFASAPVVRALAERTGHRRG
jgi:pantetheine-phosphate adenylyltransferase